MSNKCFAACHWSRDHTWSNTDGETHLRVTRETPPPPRSWAIFTPARASHCSRVCVRVGRFLRAHGQRGGVPFLERGTGGYWQLGVGLHPPGNRGGRQSSVCCRGAHPVLFRHLALVGNTLELEARARQRPEGSAQKAGIPGPPREGFATAGCKRRGNIRVGGPTSAAQPGIRIQPHTSSRATVTRKENPKQPQQPVSAQIRPKRQRGSFSLTQGRFDLLPPGVWLHVPRLPGDPSAISGPGTKSVSASERRG